MAAQPIYIETEEEIPEVIERVRQTPAEDVPLVLPTRSRFGESRFNFRLLRQYAARMGKRVAIISPDPAVQQMAEENGLRAFPAVEHLALGAEMAAQQVGAGAAMAAPALDRPPARALPEPAAALPRVAVREPARLPSRIAVDAHPTRLLLYTGAALILIAGLVAGILYVPSAQVTLTADATPFVQSNLRVDAAPGSAPVKVRTASVTKQASASFKATGTKTTPAQVATGVVTFTGSCPPLILPLRAGARVATANGVQFATKAYVEVTSAQPQDVPVVATAPGAGGNVGAGQITQIVGLGAGSACFSVTNHLPTTGGADEKQEPQIQTSDVETARQALDAQLRKDIGDELARQAGPGEKLSEQLVFSTAEFNADHAVGDVTGTFNATMKLGAEGAFYAPGDVQKAFTDLLRKKVPPGQQLTDNQPRIDYHVTNASSGGHVTFMGTASGLVAPRIDFDRLKASLAGRSVGAARAQLKHLPVRSAVVKQSPFSFPWMPLSSSRISVRYELDQVGGPPAPPAAKTP